jgi:hypothetical protein
VIKLARRLRWSAKVAVARIERALPVKFEQQVYLSVADGFSIHPESLAKLLAMFRGDRPLAIEDLENRPSGSKNIVVNRFGEFSDFLSACMNLVKIVPQEFCGLALGMELAGKMVMEYGTKNPEQVIEMIDTNLDECCEFFGISPFHDYPKRMRLCIWNYMDNILPELRKRGVPDPLDPAEFIGDWSFQRYCSGEHLDVYDDDPVLRREIHDLLKGGDVS